VRLRCSGAVELTKQRRQAMALAEAALEAIDTGAALLAAVRLGSAGLEVLGENHPLPEGRLLLVAVGKCAAAAARALGDLLGERLAAGVVLDVLPAEGQRLHPRLRYHQGTHPLPSEANVSAAREVVALLESAGAEDLVLVVVSGGGSTLLCLPPGGLTWEDERTLFNALTRRGAAIREINTVRKHTSLARGGFLARHAHPARVVSLVFSDVPGAAVEFVASGPTARDTTSVADARRVLESYDLLDAVDPRWLLETPKEERYFERVRHVMVVSNGRALEAMADRARACGLMPRLMDTAFSGEAREVARRVVSELRESPPGAVLLYGGESTVTVRGRGRGGRNAELALAALPLLGPGECVLALASDGRDNSDFAGAVADLAAAERAAALGLDPAAALANHDSYGFFERTGDALVSGATGANVADLVLALKS
jgi:glycerate-2-kinase